MLRPVEVQAMLRTVFQLWKRHHAYIKALFRGRIRAQAFFKATLLRKLVKAWRRRIKRKRVLMLKGLEIAGNHLKVLKDKSIAGFISNILRKRTNQTQVLAAQKKVAILLKRRVISVLKTHNSYALWKAEAHRSALVCWRERKLRISLSGMRLEIGRNLRERKLRETAGSCFKERSLKEGLRQLRRWAQGSGGRARYRLESFFAWKRYAYHKVLSVLQSLRTHHFLLTQATLQTVTFQRIWREKRTFHQLKTNFSTRKWVSELNRRAKEFQLLISPTHAILTGLRSLQMNHVFKREFRSYAVQAEVKWKFARFRRFKKACFQSLAGKYEEMKTWRRKRVKMAVFKQWVEKCTRKLVENQCLDSAIRGKNRKVLARILRGWEGFAEKRASLHSKAFELYQSVRLRRLSSHFSHWFDSLGKKIEQSEKNAIAEKENRLRLFRLLMTACASRLHYRRTKEYAQGMHQGRIRREVVRLWREYTTRKERLRLILKEVVFAKRRNLIKAWSNVSAETILAETKVTQGKLLHFRWLKATTLKSLRLFLELNMGAIAKRRILMKRKRVIFAKWTLDRWTRGMEIIRTEKAKARIIKLKQRNRQTMHIFQQWRTRLQQKFAIKGIKLKKTSIAAGKIDKIKMKNSFGIWKMYRSWRIERKETYQKADFHRKIINKTKFLARFRAFYSTKMRRNREITMALDQYRSKLASKTIFAFKKKLSIAGSKRLLVVSALNFWACHMYRLSFIGFLRNAQFQKQKKEQETEALEVRKADLVSAALQHIVKVGLQWKVQRHQVASQARVKKEQRIWSAVAKFAFRWKTKTFQKREGKAKVLEDKKIVTPAKAVAPVSMIETAPPRTRPPPRRLVSSFGDSKSEVPAVEGTKSRTEAPVSIKKAVIRPLAIRANPHYDGSAEIRLQAIEAELLDFKFERDKVAEYELFVSSRPGNPSFQTQLDLMKSRLNVQKPRIRALYEEIKTLKAGKSG